MAANMINYMGNVDSKFYRDHLIEALVKFRDAHIKEYNDALEVYRTDVISAVKDLAKKLKASDFKHFEVRANLGLITPVNVVSEYNKMIELFSRIVDDQIELSFTEANHILNNDWSWAETASASNSFYSSRKI